MNTQADILEREYAACGTAGATQGASDPRRVVRFGFDGSARQDADGSVGGEGEDVAPVLQVILGQAVGRERVPHEQPAMAEVVDSVSLLVGEREDSRPRVVRVLGIPGGRHASHLRTGSLPAPNGRRNI
jgi:hypothetical protein